MLNTFCFAVFCPHLAAYSFAVFVTVCLARAALCVLFFSGVCIPSDDTADGTYACKSQQLTGSAPNTVLPDGQLAHQVCNR